MQEPTFQRLIFITMLAWENPYHEHTNASEEIAFQVSTLLNSCHIFVFHCCERRTRDIFFVIPKKRKKKKKITDILLMSKLM